MGKWEVGNGNWGKKWKIREILRKRKIWGIWKMGNCNWKKMNKCTLNNCSNFSKSFICSTVPQSPSA
jgi:hypothetical protein